MNSLQPSLLYTFLGFFSFLLLLLKDKLDRRLRRLPPGPSGLPVLGNLLLLGRKPNESLQALSAKYGPIMSLQLGVKTVVVVSSPHLAKEVLKTHDRDFAGRDPIQASKVLDHYRRSFIFAQPSRYWRMLRRISNTEIFSPRKLESLQCLRSSEIFVTVSEIYEDSKQEKFVDFRKRLMETSLNLLGQMVFGNSMFPRNSGQFRDFQEDLQRLAKRGGEPNLGDFLPIARWMDPQRVLRDTEINMKKVYETIDGIILQRLEKRRLEMGENGQEETNDVLDTLLDLLSSDFTVDDIRVFLTDILIAGTGTTTITIEWAMAELIRNPSALKKAQTEIDQVVGKGKIIDETDIEDLEYLQAVIKETLRLHSPAPLLVPHRAEKSCEIGGFVVPKDAQIIVNFWAIGRDPEIWEKPQKFSPERFIGSKMDFRGQNFELIPFGAGRRICAGMPLARILMHSLLGALIQCFDWRSDCDIEMDYDFGVTCDMTTPLKAFANPRLPSHLYFQ
eukprot:TRINITY_DN854_c0_g2_i1.p1 TRINITY_DN854_c0_g2~~TRINITY_DN854_c0_g2_i1.p1  ORF type:complete len:504 (-),score=79.75 TRINITY_DN854_c0_g2_i1:21-1532(-)